jgi:hypothetical protein
MSGFEQYNLAPDGGLACRRSKTTCFHADRAELDGTPNASFFS